MAPIPRGLPWSTPQGARQTGFPIPAIAGWPVGLWLLAGALSVAVGVWPDLGSLMIAAFVVPAALFFHAFWKVEDQTQRQTERGVGRIYSVHSSEQGIGTRLRTSTPSVPATQSGALRTGPMEAGLRS